LKINHAAFAAGTRARGFSLKLPVYNPTEVGQCTGENDSQKYFLNHGQIYDSVVKGQWIDCSQPDGIAQKCTPIGEKGFCFKRISNGSKFGNASTPIILLC
jgi:hypothetical protein